jgi:hypothetical protein
MLTVKLRAGDGGVAAFPTVPAFWQLKERSKTLSTARKEFWAGDLGFGRPFLVGGCMRDPWLF